MAVTACSDDGSGDSEVDDSPITSSLAQIPESVRVDGFEMIAYGDLERAGELIGRSRPDFDPGETEDFFDWVRNLVGFPLEDDVRVEVFVALPNVTSPQRIDRLDEFTEELGWSAIEMSSFIEYQAPPDSLTVMRGDFSADRIDSAVGTREDDIWRVGDEDLSINADERSVARPLGESVRMALNDDLLAVSRATGPVADWLGDGDTLADDDDLVAVASALDAAGSYSALLVVEPSGNRPAYGVGLSLVDGDPVATFVYLYDDARDATDAAARLEALIADGTSNATDRPWSDAFTIDSIEIDDRLVVASLQLEDFNPGSVFAVVYTRDNIIALE